MNPLSLLRDVSTKGTPTDEVVRVLQYLQERPGLIHPLSYNDTFEFFYLLEYIFDTTRVEAIAQAILPLVNQHMETTNRNEDQARLPRLWGFTRNSLILWANAARRRSY